MPRIHSRFFLFALAFSRFAAAQPSQPPLPADQRTVWWQDAKFGMFIHWGGYAVIGRDEWARNMFHIPEAEYEEYARQLNPVNFDPFAWVDLAQSAGVRYMVITSKHHEGFSMFRSDVSDYGIKMTPYAGDPLKMLSEAAKARHMPLGFYYSIMDWHNPDYRPKRDWESDHPKEGGDMPRYLTFMRAQLRELLSRYGDVAVLWFDGEWEHTPEEIDADGVYSMIREMQPNTLINDRLFNRKTGSRGDFGTPEQFVPATGVTDANGKPALWESCVTINTSSWGYNRYETQFKTNRDLIRMLIDVVSKGGNLLLNIGPRPDGTIQPEFVSRLQAMGAWMKVNSDSIYATHASPFSTLPFFGRATQKGDTLYLHVFQWPRDGKLRVPALQNKVLSAHLLAVPGAPLGIARDRGDVVLTLPQTAPDEAASVIALELDGPPRAGEFRFHPDAGGMLTLGAESAKIETQFEQRAKLENALGHVFLTQWSKPQDVPYWDVEIPRAGRYQVAISYAATKPAIGSGYSVLDGAANLSAAVKNASGDWVFSEEKIGELELPAGKSQVKVKIAGKDGQNVMQLERVTLKPVR